MEKNYYYSIDFLKFFCAIAVVLIHVSAPIAGNDLATFWNYYIYRYFLDIGVPFFFIASGFFLAEKFKKLQSLDVYYSYIVKIFSYLLTFTLFYIIVKLILRSVNAVVFGTSIENAVVDVIKTISYQNILNGSVGSTQLYFLANLIYCTFTLLLFSKFKIKPITLLSVAIFMYFISKSGVLKFPVLFKYTDYFEGLLFISIGFFMSDLAVNRVKYPIIFSVLFGFLYFLSKHYHLGILSAVFLPLFAYYTAVFGVKNPSLGKDTLIVKLSRYSLAIYILHILVIWIMKEIYIYIGFEDWFKWKPHYIITLFLGVIVPMFIFTPIYNTLMIIKGKWIYEKQPISPE